MLLVADFLFITSSSFSRPPRLPPGFVEKTSSEALMKPRLKTNQTFPREKKWGGGGERQSEGKKNHENPCRHRHQRSGLLFLLLLLRRNSETINTGFVIALSSSSSSSFSSSFLFPSRPQSPIFAPRGRRREPRMEMRQNKRRPEERKRRRGEKRPEIPKVRVKVSWPRRHLPSSSSSHSDRGGGEGRERKKLGFNGRRRHWTLPVLLPICHPCYAHTPTHTHTHSCPSRPLLTSCVKEADTEIRIVDALLDLRPLLFFLCLPTDG